MAGPLPTPESASRGWFVVAVGGVIAWVAVVTFFFLR